MNIFLQSFKVFLISQGKIEYNCCCALRMLPIFIIFYNLRLICFGTALAETKQSRMNPGIFSTSIYISFRET